MIEPGDVLAEGSWCTVCQFFEQDEITTAAVCQCCGCAPAAHQPCRLVAVPVTPAPVSS